MEAKKRKAEDATESAPDGDVDVISEEDIAELADLLSKEQLVSIVKKAALSNADILSKLRKITDEDFSARNLLVKGLNLSTDNGNLKKAFGKYGPVKKAAVIVDKSTGKSRGFGFVTFLHTDAAIRALKAPNKIIDGRKTICCLQASAGDTASAAKSKDEGLKPGAQKSKDEGLKPAAQKSKDEGLKPGGYELTDPALIASHNPSFLQSSSRSLGQSLIPTAGLSSLHGFDPRMSFSPSLLPPDSAYASSSLASMYGLPSSDQGSLSRSYPSSTTMHNRQVSGYSSLPRSSFY